MIVSTKIKRLSCEWGGYKLKFWNMESSHRKKKKKKRRKKLNLVFKMLLLVVGYRILCMYFNFHEALYLVFCIYYLQALFLVLGDICSDRYLRICHFHLWNFHHWVFGNQKAWWGQWVLSICLKCIYIPNILKKKKPMIPVPMWLS